MIDTLADARADLPDHGLSVCAGREPEGAGQHGRGVGGADEEGSGEAHLFVRGHGQRQPLSGALFAEAAGIELTHVPYKGTGPALADVISGIITMNFSSLPPAVPQVKAGNLKALAVTGDQRLTSLPDVPTLKEQGIDAVINGWHGLFAPANTPDALLDTIAKDAKQAMKDPKWAEALAKDGVETPPERTRAELARYIADEHAFWGKKLKALKIDMDDAPARVIPSTCEGSLRISKGPSLRSGMTAGA